MSTFKRSHKNEMPKPPKLYPPARAVKAQLLDVICAIDRNANATDDELEETWATVLAEWESVQDIMAQYTERD